MVQRAYRIDAIDRLRAEQLRSAPPEERVRRIDRIEQAIGDIEAGSDYAVDRIVKNIGCGGWVPRDRDKAQGTDLIHDLRLLVEDLSDSVDLPADAVGEQVLTVDDLARHFSVSTKTINRWREAGLVSRRLVFDGRKRVGFLRSSVDRFVRNNRDRVQRSAKFRQMTDVERGELVAEARRLADEGLDLNTSARRLSARTGRTAETIRAALRQHAEANPRELPFADESVITESQRLQIEADYRAEVPAETLVTRYGRSKSTIYRIVTEVRYERVQELPLDHIPNDRFTRRGADAACLGEMPEPETATRRPSRPADLPAYLAALYEAPLLTREQEQHLFRKYNYLKHKAAKLRQTLDAERPKASVMDDIERLYEQAVTLKNQIARANLRLVVSIAKKRMSPTQGFFELVSDGNVSLMKAIEKFDFARGNKFSTYATWAIVKNYARSIPNEYKHHDRFRSGADELFAATEEHRDNPRAHEAAQADRKHKIRRILRRLDEREQQIVISRFGLDHSREPLTLKQVGAEMGVTKERVRQLEVRALDKLRAAAAEERVHLDL
ncbi:MAG: sigma-70 family RNA polymerase sigma factor [Planctomycetota bacterium]